MARYIDADKVHKFVDEKAAEGKDGWAKGVPYEWSYALTVIDMQPAADVVPKSEVAMIFEELYNSVASKIQPHIRPICSDDLGFDAGFRNGKTDALLDTLVIIAELRKKHLEEGK